jgi:hypothetical protein
VYSGPGLVEIPLSALDPIGSSGDANYGFPIAGAGDVNGDGQLDVAVGNPGGSGTVTYYLGAPGGFAGASTFQVSNDIAGGAGDKFGASIGAGRHPWLGPIGDMDGDRTADTIIGSNEVGLTLTGAVQLFYLGRPATNRLRSSGISFGPSTGASQNLNGAYVGDVNGDGFSDIALGDRLYNAGAGRMTIQY